jgi:hypothetical protein
MTSLLLIVTLAGQSPEGGPSQVVKPATTQEAVTGKAPAASTSKPGARSTMSEEYRKGLRSTLARKRAAAHRRALTNGQKAQVEASVAKAISEWEAKVGPTIAAQQREQMRLQILAQQTAAMQQMAAAAQMEAANNNARLRLESQALGQSQIFVPGVGMVPYPYSIIQPITPGPGTGQATAPR